MEVPNPDVKGRREILGLYLAKIKHDDSVDLESIASRTTGFSGADLQVGGMNRCCWKLDIVAPLVIDLPCANYTPLLNVPVTSNLLIESLLYMG